MSGSAHLLSKITMNNSKQSIISVNLDARLSRLIKLEEVIRFNQPIVCLLQDVPRINPAALTDTLQMIASNYYPMYNNDHLRRFKKIENLILVDKERAVIHRLHFYNVRSKASAMGISINRIREEMVMESGNGTAEFVTRRVDYGDMIIFSVYIRPRATYCEAKLCLDWISDTVKNNEGPSRTVIMGDMNAIEATWCPIDNIVNNRENSEHHYKQLMIVRGRLVAKHFATMKLTCLNRTSQGPTCESINSNSYIDLAFVGNKVLRSWKELTLRKIWERPAHKAMILSSRGQSQYRFRSRTYKRVKPELLSENHFLETHLQCDQLCTNWRQLPRDRVIKRMDRITSVLYKSLEIAQEKVTVRVTRKLPSKDRQHWRGVMNIRVRRMIHRLHRKENRILKLSRSIRRIRLRGSGRNDRGNLQGFAASRQQLKLEVASLRRAIIDRLGNNKLAESIENFDDHELWKRVHVFEGLFSRRSVPGIGGANSRIKTRDDIERLADEKFPQYDRVTKNYVANAYKQSSAHVRMDINDEEIFTAVRSLRNKTFTSSEGIKMNLFFVALEFVANIVRTLMEMSFWICYIPKKARMTQGTLIPKKAAGQFRIVHISSPLAVLFELVALRRLEFRLESNRLNSPYQFGFSKMISRHDLLARILEFFYSEYLRLGRKASGLIISLDIEGAFDNVNQDKIIQKLDRELADDPIKFWIAEFILNRKICVKSGDIRSSVRDICLGVPQGSALGPVLWNYMIHDIDTGIARPGRTELVRYADDIILLYNGSNKIMAQSMLDRLVQKLGDINLNIRPEKCSVMGIRLGCRDRRLNHYHINGIKIRNVDRMNILGVPVTRKLMLDRSSPELKENFLESVRKLHNIGRLGLVNSAKEWRILIDSYIKSRVVLNYWPILILDHKSCKWTDDNMIRALRTIFNWPSNTSIKLIRLITGTLECREIVTRTTKLRALSEFGRLYNFLLKIGQPDFIRQTLELSYEDRLNNNMINNRFNLETVIRNRKHLDPTKQLNVKHAENFIREVETNGPTWILLDRSKGSMLAEVHKGREITQFKLGRHSDYPISYFNSFALILKVVSERTCSYRSLTLSEKSSLLSALENPNNSDWRVIQLRERMSDNGWRINKISHVEDMRLRNALAEKYKNTALRHDINTVMNDFGLWLAFNEQNTEQQVEPDVRPSYQVESLTEPCLFDYKRRNHLRKWALSEDRTIFLRYHTSITRALSTQLGIWQSMPPSWLDGARMLALSGMTTNSNGQLEMGNREPSETCHLCENLEFSVNLHDNSDNWHGVNAITINSNLVLHKTLVCKALQMEREEFLKHTMMELSLNRSELMGSETIERILANKRTYQRLLSFMVKCNKTN